MEERDVDETKTKPERGGSRRNHTRKTCTNADKRVRITERKKRCQLDSNFHKPTSTASNHTIPDPQLALFLPLSPSILFCSAISWDDTTALNPLECECE